MNQHGIYMPKTILVAHSFGYNKQFGYSGIDRYSQELDEGLTSIGYKHDKYAYNKNNLLKRLFASPKAVKGYDIIHLAQPHGYEAFIWSKAKKVLTWHDKDIFLRKRKGRFYNLFRGLMAYKFANTITFNSKQSYDELKEYIQKYMRFDEGKIYDVTPLPLEDIWIKQKVSKKLSRKGFIYIGAINYEHKNLKGLMETYKEISNKVPNMKNLPLHIFTSSSDAQKLIKEAKAKTKAKSIFPIILHERSSDAEILKYLKQSIALLHLSKYEGYGLPLMESIAVGTPVITLKEAKIPEEVAKWTIRTDDAASAAIKLYNKPRSASQDAIKYAKSLTKENYAKKMVKLYEGV